MPGPSAKMTRTGFRQPRPMAADRQCDGLRLPDLRVEGFRGIGELSIPRLGRVTLLAGRNGIGKTTVLDAVQIFAARGRPLVIHGLLQGREEFATALDEDHDPVVVPDFNALFHGRNPREVPAILIGPSNGGEEALRLRMSGGEAWTPAQQELFSRLAVDTDVTALSITVGSRERLFPWGLSGEKGDLFEPRARFSLRRLQRLFDDDDWPTGIAYQSLGPGLLSTRQLATLWDEVALTDDEVASRRALRLALDRDIDGVAVVGDDARGPGRARHRVVVKLPEHRRPVPLRSLGDGATRMFAVALALANSRNGFLVIDEAENGIHHSVQRDFWNMVLRTAQENDVQVLATTHGWDCVTGFARACADCADIEGVLIRIERAGEGLRAVEYSQEDLETVADQGIEVR